MKLLVLTSRSDLQQSPFWSVIEDVEGIDAILLCIQGRPGNPRAVLGRQWKNLTRYGPLYLPYRIAVAFRSLLPSADKSNFVLYTRTEPRPSVETLRAENLHSTGVLERIRSWEPDLGLSVGAPILRRELFDIPTRGSVNVHGGRVPDFRGAPPGFWELYTGAVSIGATLHWIEESLDTGDVIEEATAPIYPHDTLDDVKARVEELSVRVLRRGLKALVAEEAHSKPQPQEGATFSFPTPRQRLERWLRAKGKRVTRAAREPVRLFKSAALLIGLLLVRPLRDLVRTALGNHPVRIFTFHRVTTLIRDGMTVSPSVFRAQVRRIKETHRVVGLRQALATLRSGERLRRPVAVITFDDGYRSVFETALPIMREEDVTGSCFICTDLVDTDRRLPHDRGHPVERFLAILSWDQIDELADSGWEIESHTASHAQLADLNEARLQEELSKPIAAIEQQIGRNATVVSYPYGGPGDVTERARAMIRKLGYDACLSDFGGENLPGDNPYQLHRIELGGDHAGLAWRARVHGIDLARFRKGRPESAGRSVVRSTK